MEFRWSAEKALAEIGTQEAINLRSSIGKGRLVKRTTIVNIVIDSLGICKVPTLALIAEFNLKHEAENLVKIPPELVENSLQTAPKNITIYNRLGETAMDLGGRRANYGTGSDLIYAIESETMERHQTTLEDIKTAARVSDALPNIDFIMSFAHPHTLKHLRETQWRPKLISRRGYDKWVKEGSTSLMDRARKKLDHILETHTPRSVPEDQAEAIQKRVSAFKG